jgi:hypothetical protein
MSIKKSKNKLWRYVLLEFIVGVCLFAVLTLPIFDYAKREILAYMQDPTPSNLEALRARRLEEQKLRVKVALPFGLAMLILLFPLCSEYKKTRTT